MVLPGTAIPALRVASSPLIGRLNLGAPCCARLAAVNQPSPDLPSLLPTPKISPSPSSSPTTPPSPNPPYLDSKLFHLQGLALAIIALSNQHFVFHARAIPLLEALALPLFRSFFQVVFLATSVIPHHLRPLLNHPPEYRRSRPSQQRHSIYFL